MIGLSWNKSLEMSAKQTYGITNTLRLKKHILDLFSRSWFLQIFQVCLGWQLNGSTRRKNENLGKKKKKPSGFQKRFSLAMSNRQIIAIFLFKIDSNIILNIWHLIKHIIKIGNSLTIPLLNFNNKVESKFRSIVILFIRKWFWMNRISFKVLFIPVAYRGHLMLCVFVRLYMWPF